LVMEVFIFWKICPILSDTNDKYSMLPQLLVWCLEDIRMKNPWEWDENDLLDMVKAGTQESIELDFKESKALLTVKGQKDVRYEVSKDVSALANSAGGVLIYGMVEDKHTHVAASLDAGSDPKVITKEWLQQIIN